MHRYALDEPSFQRLRAGKEQVEVKEIRHRLPCALVSGKRNQVFVKAAADAATHAGLDLLKCVNLNMDQYLNKPKLEIDAKWDFSRYKSVEKPSKSYNTRSNPQQPAQLENRLLLFAETQIGKNGRVHSLFA